MTTNPSNPSQQTPPPTHPTMTTNPSNPDQQPPPPTPPATDNQAQDRKKWGTHVMGPPSNPTAHPDNQRATTWDASEHQRMFFHDQKQPPPPPYVVHSPTQRPASSPQKPVVHSFNNWSRKAETIARNIWHNLRTGPSVSEAAWGKINLTARVVSEGGFEGMFRHTFEVQGNEKLKKTFVCYLSTTTGPVAGTLYLSDARVGFCSDRPLSFHAPSGQEAWSYYKVNIPLACLSSVNPTEKYIHLITVDNHDFWFMGFVNFEKATHHLSSTLSESRAAELGPGTPAAELGPGTPAAELGARPPAAELGAGPPAEELGARPPAAKLGTVVSEEYYDK